MLNSIEKFKVAILYLKREWSHCITTYPVCYGFTGLNKKGCTPIQVFPVPNVLQFFCCLLMHNMHIVYKFQLDLNAYTLVYAFRFI